MEAQAKPLPRDETTPPVMKINFDRKPYSPLTKISMMW
jgi:hypothetical protein